MKIRVAIEQEFDLNDDAIFINDDPFFDENAESYTVENRTDILISRFLEDIDYLVKYDKVPQAITVEYIED